MRFGIEIQKVCPYVLNQILRHLYCYVGLQFVGRAPSTSTHFGLFGVAGSQSQHDGARGHLQRQRLPKAALASLPLIRHHGFQHRGKLKVNAPLRPATSCAQAVPGGGHHDLALHFNS